MKQSSDGFMYEFKFETRFNSYEGRIRQVIPVYSTNMDDMILFLKQHGFKPDSVNSISTVSVENIKGAEYVLNKYLFKSNKFDGVYTINTIENFVTKAIYSVTSDLSNSLTFGPAILKTDFKLIETIHNLINELPHVYILDGQFIDGDSGNLISEGEELIREFKNCFSLTRPYSYTTEVEMPDDSFIVDSMMSDSTNREKVQPITLEAYVRSFIENFVEYYQERNDV